MNKNTSIMAGVIAVAGVLTLSVVAQAQAQSETIIIGPFHTIPCISGDPPKESTGWDGSTHIAIGGGGECMSGGTGGAGGEGGQGGTNLVKDTGKNADVDQDANGWKSNGGYGGNANGGNGFVH